MRRILGLVCALLLLGAAPPPLEGAGGAVATDHALASEAGAEILRAGGNAVDAAVAAALAAGVVQPSGSGLGGGGFALVHLDGHTRVLDFREVAPRGATRDMFLDAGGQPRPGASTEGGLAVAVPAEWAGLAELHRRWGRLPLAAVARPAVRLARRGFPIGTHLREELQARPEMVPRLFPDGAPPDLRGTVRRPRLARAIAAWARTGGEALRRGPLADDLVRTVREAGGILTAEDLAAYRPVERDPLVGTARGRTVLTMPPPSSGGAVLLQALEVLEGFDLASLGPAGSDHLHLLAETFQHGFADRARLMGDPDFVEVPVQAMLAPRRIEDIRRSILPFRTLDAEAYGTPVAPPADGGTQHISVVDGEGGAVALTTTINTPFGSGLVATASGIVLNNEMDDFSIAPGVPNAYGLVGREANAVAPGKRPLSSMSPTIVLDREGRVEIAIGASGGPFIITSTVQVLSNLLDLGLDPAEAVARPRMHHQWMPPVLFLDEDIPLDVVRNLRVRGHEVRQMAFFSSVQVVQRLPDGRVRAASDPRKGGRAAVARQ